MATVQIPPLTITASSNLSYTPASRLSDGDLSTLWMSGRAQAAGDWMQFDLGVARDVRQLTIQASSSNGYPTAWKVEHSQTGAFAGEQRQVATGTAAAFGVLVTPIPSGEVARYWRVTITLSTGNWLKLAELQWFREDTPKPDPPTGVTAANTGTARPTISISGSYSHPAGTAEGGVIFAFHGASGAVVHVSPQQPAGTRSYTPSLDIEALGAVTPRAAFVDTAGAQGGWGNATSYQTPSSGYELVLDFAADAVATPAIPAGWSADGTNNSQIKAGGTRGKLLCSESVSNISLLNDAIGSFSSAKFLIRMHVATGSAGGTPINYRVNLLRSGPNGDGYFLEAGRRMFTSGSSATGDLRVGRQNVSTLTVAGTLAKPLWPAWVSGGGAAQAQDAINMKGEVTPIVAGKRRLRLSAWLGAIDAAPAVWDLDVEEIIPAGQASFASGKLGLFAGWEINGTVCIDYLAISRDGWTPGPANARPSPPSLAHSAVTATTATITRTPGVDPDGDPIVATRLQVSTSSDFTTGIVYDSGAAGEAPYASKELTGLTPEWTYYYRGAEYDAGGAGDWSGTGNFTTLVAPPPNLPPTNPVLIRPYQDPLEVVDTRLTIDYTPGTDPEGAVVSHTARYRLVGAPAWTEAFSGRTDTGPFYLDGFGANPDGTYELELWASDGVQQSATVTGQFLKNSGAPSEIELITPAQGGAYAQAPLTVQWVHATDPDGDPLTEAARWRPVGGAWTALFSQSGTATPQYAWDLTGFAVGEYELEIWANDGTSDGPRTIHRFTLTTLSRPAKPVIISVVPTTESLEATAGPYQHPQGVPHKASRWQLQTRGGDWSDPTVDTTSLSELLSYLFGGLVDGAAFEIRVAFQDTNDQWSEWSDPRVAATLGIGDQWVPKWEVRSLWTVREFFEGRNSKESGNDSGLVNVGYPSVGSFRVEGEVVIAGCECGYSWERAMDREYVLAGVGAVDGTDPVGDSVGSYGAIRTGFTVNAYGYGGVSGGTQAEMVVRVRLADGSTVYRRAPIGLFLTEDRRFGRFLPWYRVVYECIRVVGGPDAPGVRVRAAAYGPEIDYLAEGEWFIDTLIPGILGPCGFPGYVQAQPIAQPTFETSGRRYFRGLEFTPLPDEGRGLLVGVPPLPPVGPEAEPACVPVLEAPPAAPVLFPAAPDWQDGVREGTAYLTDVISAQDDTEQRVQLREVPVRTLAYTLALMDAREVGLVQGLLWDLQPARWGVPLWPDAAVLLADVAAGALSIPPSSFPATGRRWDSGWAVLWRDVYTAELVGTVLEVDGSLTLAAAASRSYLAGEALLIPARIGRLPASLKLRRPATFVAEMEIEFRLEATL